MSDTVDNFWIESEHDIRDRLAKTEQKIGTAVRVLAKAAQRFPEITMAAIRQPFPSHQRQVTVSNWQTKVSQRR